MIGRVHIFDLFLFDVDIRCLGGDRFEVVDSGTCAGDRLVLLHHIESEMSMGVGRD
jgi:hypothetical protein